MKCPSIVTTPPNGLLHGTFASVKIASVGYELAGSGLSIEKSCNFTARCRHILSESGSKVQALGPTATEPTIIQFRCLLSIFAWFRYGRCAPKFVKRASCQISMQTWMSWKTPGYDFLSIISSFASLKRQPIAWMTHAKKNMWKQRKLPKALQISPELLQGTCLLLIVLLCLSCFALDIDSNGCYVCCSKHSVSGARRWLPC